MEIGEETKKREKSEAYLLAQTEPFSSPSLTNNPQTGGSTTVVNSDINLRSTPSLSLFLSVLAVVLSHHHETNQRLPQTKQNRLSLSLSLSHNPRSLSLSSRLTIRTSEATIAASSHSSLLSLPQNTPLSQNNTSPLSSPHSLSLSHHHPQRNLLPPPLSLNIYHHHQNLRALSLRIPSLSLSILSLSRSLLSLSL